MLRKLPATYPRTIVDSCSCQSGQLVRATWMAHPSPPEIAHSVAFTDVRRTAGPAIPSSACRVLHVGAVSTASM
jgi:hypothetical protein